MLIRVNDIPPTRRKVNGKKQHEWNYVEYNYYMGNKNSTQRKIEKR